MKLQSHETELIGKWIEEKGQVRNDAASERIAWLTSHYLRKLTVSKQWGGWETLFQDPDDGRYWEQTFPQSEMHGGGPPSLKCLSREEAKAKYGEKIDSV
jgi:Immunity protein 27